MRRILRDALFFVYDILFIVMNFMKKSLHFLLHFVRYSFIMVSNHVY